MEKKQIKKWNDQTQEERKKTKNKAFIFLFCVLFLIFMFLNHHSGREESQEKDYISCTSPSDIASELRTNGYRIQILSNNSIYWYSCQPKDTYGDYFFDRIQIYSDNSDKISAIRIESLSGDTKISSDSSAKEHFLWIGNLLHYPKNIGNWIKLNFNKKRASLMLDKYTKITIYSPYDYCRVMDIFKVNDTNKTSPIPKDKFKLFGY